MLTRATRLILSGEAVKIDAPPPSFLYEQGVKEWYMAQPEDWLYDDAQMIYEATFRRALAMDEIKMFLDSPPSDSWIALRELLMETTKKRIGELDSVESRTPDEETELLEAKQYLENAIGPDEWNLGYEMAQERAINARENWLLPRLICNKKKQLLFDVDTPAGKELWAKVPRNTRERVLKPYLKVVLGYVKTAKNSDGGQDSN